MCFVPRLLWDLLCPRVPQQTWKEWKGPAKYESRLLWHKRSKCQETGITEIRKKQDESIPKVKEFSQINQLSPQRLECSDYSYNMKPDMKKCSNIYCDWKKRLKMSHKEIMTLSVLPNMEILLQVLKCLVSAFWSLISWWLHGTCDFFFWIILEKSKAQNFTKKMNKKGITMLLNKNKNVHAAENSNISRCAFMLK